MDQKINQLINCGSEVQRLKGLMRLIVDQRINRLINQSINCGSEVQRLKGSRVQRYMGSEVVRINEINSGSEDQSVDQSVDQLWIRGTVINPIDQC